MSQPQLVQVGVPYVLSSRTMAPVPDASYTFDQSFDGNTFVIEYIRATVSSNHGDEVYLVIKDGGLLVDVGVGFHLPVVKKVFELDKLVKIPTVNHLTVEIGRSNLGGPDPADPMEIVLLVAGSIYPTQ